MSIKKTLLLATMAVAAVAFAAPSAALADGAHFLDNGQAIGAGGVTTHTTGPIGFAGPAGSYECQAHPELTVNTHSASINALNITTDDCVATGAFAHCKLNTHFLTSGSSIVPTEEGDAVLENFRLTNVFETGTPGTGDTSTTACNLAGLPLELIFEEITLTPDNPNEISTFSAEGTGALVIEPNTPIAALTATGDLEVVEAEQGTISIANIP